MKKRILAMVLASLTALNPVPAQENEPEDNGIKIPEIQDFKLEPLVTFNYTCIYASGDGLREAIEPMLSARGKAVYSESLNALIVVDEKDVLDGIKKIIKALDRPIPQIQVEARIVEITLDEDLEKELSAVFTRSNLSTAAVHGGFFTLGTPGSTPSTDGGSVSGLFTDSDRSENINTFIRLLITNNQARVLSSPNIVVSYNEEASIITGEEVPITTTQNTGGTVSTSTTFKSVGIKLKVSPKQIGKKTVKLQVSPSVSAVTRFSGDNPIVAVRSAKTTLTVQDGQLLVIGGLRRDSKQTIEKKIPLLGDIPLLGWFFKSEREQEVKTLLVFYLKVDILEDGEQPTERHKRDKDFDKKIDELGEALGPDEEEKKEEDDAGEGDDD